MLTCCGARAVAQHQSVTEAVAAVNLKSSRRQISFCSGHPVYTDKACPIGSYRIGQRVDRWLQANRSLFLDCENLGELRDLQELFTALQQTPAVSEQCRDSLSELATKTLRSWQDQAPWEHGLLGVQANPGPHPLLDNSEITILYSAKERPLTCAGGLLDAFPNAATVFASLPKNVAVSLAGLLSMNGEAVWLDPIDFQLLAYAFDALEADEYAERLWRKAFAHMPLDSLLRRLGEEEDDTKRLWMAQVLALRIADKELLDHPCLGKLDADLVRLVCTHAGPNFAARLRFIRAWATCASAKLRCQLDVTQCVDLSGTSCDWFTSEFSSRHLLHDVMPDAKRSAWICYLSEPESYPCPLNTQQRAALQRENPAVEADPTKPLQLPSVLPIFFASRESRLKRGGVCSIQLGPGRSILVDRGLVRPQWLEQGSLLRRASPKVLTSFVRYLYGLEQPAPQSALEKLIKALEKQ